MKTNVPLLLALVFASLFSGAQIPELWGVASNYGAGGAGTVFKLNADGSGFDTACSLNTPTGSFPAGHLLLNGDGLLYGTAFNGGARSAGTLFSVNPVTNEFTKLYDLDSLGNSWVNSNLVRANDTTFYGTKSQGGTGVYTGRLFRFNPFNNSYATIYSFPDPVQGKHPRNIILGPDGLLYGTTDAGGAQNEGVLFSFDPATGTYTNMHDFDTINGSNTTGIIYADNNLLYGLTSAKDTNHYGTIFSLELSSYTYTTLYNFSDSTGYPSWNNTMIKGNDGKFYGMLYGGGAFNAAGTIFSFNPVGNIYQKLYDFRTDKGTDPICSLIQATDGNLYGLTAHGGNDDKGVVFRFNITDSTYTVLQSLSNAKGGGSYGGLTELAPLTGIAEQPVAAAIDVYPNPAIDELHIRSEEHFTNYTIYTVTGELVRSATLPSTGTIPITGIPAGCYLLEVKNKNVAARKVIVKE